MLILWQSDAVSLPGLMVVTLVLLTCIAPDPKPIRYHTRDHQKNNTDKQNPTFAFILAKHRLFFGVAFRLFRGGLR
ncbi:MAG: hypothetical protein ABI042_05665 [Verrucomicrobiota bacterium]